MFVERTVMKTINKLLISLLICTASIAPALADDSGSTFTCQAQQNALASTNAIATQQTCPDGQETWVVVNNGKLSLFCMGRSGGGPSTPLTSTCEVNPAFWAEYSAERHVCRGTPEQCSVEVY